MSDEKEVQSTNSRVEKSQRVAKTIKEKYADVTLKLIEQHGDEFGPLAPDKKRKLRWKLYLNIMGLLSAINVILFVSILP